MLGSEKLVRYSLLAGERGVGDQWYELAPAKPLAQINDPILLANPGFPMIAPFWEPRSDAAAGQLLGVEIVP